MDNQNKVDIFGVKFDNLTVHQIAGLLHEKILAKTPQTIVFTPNPEIVIEAGKDAELFAAIQKADIISADGIGIVWASKYFGVKIKERASGYDIVQELFRFSGKDGYSAFFFGGGEDAVTKSALNMEKKYPGLKVVGTRNGFFSPDESAAIINQINAAAPDLLLVGLGSPKQEKWVSANAGEISSTVIMVVGGSFDVMSGNLKRAPRAFQKLGLEWLYRLLRQPKRIMRMARLPLFVIKVLMKNAKKRNT